MIDEVASDRVVHASRKRDLQLRPDSVSRSDQHRLLQTRERAIKHPAKTSDLRKRPLIERATRQLLDPIGRASGCININTRIAIGD